MKRSSIVLIVGVMLLQAMVALADEADLTHRLVGTWTDSPGYYGSQMVTVTYYANGTCVGRLHSRGQPETTDVLISANWFIKDGILTKTTTSSDPPERIPAGVKVKDRIISISEDRFVYQEVEMPWDGTSGPETKVRKK